MCVAEGRMSKCMSGVINEVKIWNEYIRGNKEITLIFDKMHPF